MKTKYYLIKHSGETYYTWLASVQDGKMVMEYNLNLKKNVTHMNSERYKKTYMEILLYNHYVVDEIPEEEAFLMLL